MRKLMDTANTDEDLHVGPEAVLARETLGYAFYTGTSGVRQNCQAAQRWFNVASLPYSPSAPHYSVMARMYLARMAAEGCPLHHDRDPETALTLYKGLLAETDVSPDLKKVLEHERQVLVYDNKDPINASPTEQGYPDNSTSSAGTATTTDPLVTGLVMLVGVIAVASLIQGPDKPGKSAAAPMHWGCRQVWAWNIPGATETGHYESQCGFEP
jgi:hypothetical protein